MKKSLFIFLSFLTTASYSQNDKGVVINGVTWATCNVGASNPEEYGEYFTLQYAFYACPKGWRLPTIEELQSLIDKKKVTSEWATINGINGRRFTDKTSGNSIFLPAAGYRDISNGTLSHKGTDGNYWSSTDYKCANIFYYAVCAHCLFFGSGGEFTNYQYVDTLGFSARLVAE